MTYNIADLPPSLAKRTVQTPSGCWEFLGAKNSRGYGSVGVGNRRTGLSHRVAYEALVGPIPEGLSIDHLCSVKVCVNPDHLEPTTFEENSRRANERDSRSCYCELDGCTACELRRANAVHRAHLKSGERRTPTGRVMSRVVGAAVEPHVYEAVAEAARARGMSVSAFAREALEAAMGRAS